MLRGGMIPLVISWSPWGSRAAAGLLYQTGYGMEGGDRRHYAPINRRMNLRYKPKTM
jgi:hypothetical protein